MGGTKNKIKGVADLDRFVLTLWLPAYVQGMFVAVEDRMRLTTVLHRGVETVEHGLSVHTN